LLGLGPSPLFLGAYRGAEALRHPKASLRGSFSLSPLRGLLLFGVLSHGLRPFGRLRQAVGYILSPLRGWSELSPGLLVGREGDGTAGPSTAPSLALRLRSG
jgi:hypothetical protein